MTTRDCASICRNSVNWGTCYSICKMPDSTCRKICSESGVLDKQDCMKDCGGTKNATVYLRSDEYSPSILPYAVVAVIGVAAVAAVAMHF